MLEGHLPSQRTMDNALPGPGIDGYYKNLSRNTGFQQPTYTAKTDHPASAGHVVASVGYRFT
jgi:hypothetical protein